MEIEVPRILHPRVRNHEIKLAKYVLMPYGLAHDSVGDITIDKKIALIQPHTEPELGLYPLVPDPQPDLSTAWFYADCIAFDHEMPVIVKPTPADIRRFGFRYIYSGTEKPPHLDTFERQCFIDQLDSILGEIRELHHGPLTYIPFRYKAWQKRVDIPYTVAYSPASQEIHLYAAALRQADTLSEYLSYYRVIESASKSNGHSWIVSAISRLREHNFDVIPIGMADENKITNLMAIFKRRSLLRLNHLLSQHKTPTNIADYLYSVNRCGIAHGRSIIRADIAPSYFEMVKDTYLIKMLARMAIEEMLGSSRLLV